MVQPRHAARRVGGHHVRDAHERIVSIAGRNGVRLFQRRRQRVHDQRVQRRVAHVPLGERRGDEQRLARARRVLHVVIVKALAVAGVIRRARPVFGGLDHIAAVARRIVTRHDRAAEQQHVVHRRVHRLDDVAVGAVVALVHLVGRRVADVVCAAAPEARQDIVLCGDRLRLQRLDRERVAHLVGDHAVEVVRKRHAVDDHELAVLRRDRQVPEIGAVVAAGPQRERAARAPERLALHGHARAGIQRAERRVRDRHPGAGRAERQFAARKRIARLRQAVRAGHRDGEFGCALRGQQHPHHGRVCARRRGQRQGDQRQQHRDPQRQSFLYRLCKRALHGKRSFLFGMKRTAAGAPRRGGRAAGRRWDGHGRPSLRL